MANKIKVGQSCEVVVITKSLDTPSLFEAGNTGIIDRQFRSGNATICIGYTDVENEIGTWYAEKDAFKKIGKLTVIKVK